MKKKETKPNRSVRKKPEDNEFSSLNSSLGSFGLEPPKRYRPDQQVKPAEAQRRASQKKNAKPQRTLDEIRVEENKKRKNAKLRRKIIFYFLLVVSIAAVIVVLSLTVLFKINTITITGNSIYKTKQIAAVLPIEKGGNLFICDTDKAEKKLEENLPYIYNAEIKRKLPSTIVVNITETPTVYSVNNNDKTYTLLDGNFKVLEVNSKKKKKTVQIKKAQIKLAVPGQQAQFSNEKIMNNLLKLTDAVSRLKLDKVTAVYSTDINNNFMVYDGRIIIKLGTLENLDKKIYSALTAIDKLNESNPQADGVMTVTDGKQVYFTEN